MSLDRSKAIRVPDIGNMEQEYLMRKTVVAAVFAVFFLVCLASCVSQPQDVEPDSRMNNINYRVSRTAEILLTSEAGDKIATKDNLPFRDGDATGVRVVIRPDRVKQTIAGIGSSFTESSAFVLAHLEAGKRMEVMSKIYGQGGANFSLTRTPIGSTDFSRFPVHQFPQYFLSKK